MCMSICLLEVNGVEKFYGFVLLKLCCDGGGVKLFIVVPLMNYNDGEISRMLY